MDLETYMLCSLAGVHHGLLLALLGQGDNRHRRGGEFRARHQSGHAGVQEHHRVHPGEIFVYFLAKITW